MLNVSMVFGRGVAKVYLFIYSVSQIKLSKRKHLLCCEHSGTFPIRNESRMRKGFFVKCLRILALSHQKRSMRNKITMAPWLILTNMQVKENDSIMQLPFRQKYIFNQNNICKVQFHGQQEIFMPSKFFQFTLHWQ